MDFILLPLILLTPWALAAPDRPEVKLDPTNCEKVVDAQKQGAITADDFADDPSCRRVFVTKGDEKLSFSFIRVEMADREKLVLEFNSERHEFGPGHTCELCIPKIVTNKLSFGLEPASSSFLKNSTVEDPQPVREKLGEIDIHDVMINDVNYLQRVESKFTVLYQTFDPDSCPATTSVSIRHGYVKGKDTRIGAEIEFKCKTPFDPIGALKARCVVEDGIPQWSASPPECHIKCDSHKFLIRKAARMRNSAVVAISNPGHESDVVSGGSEVCKWELRAPEGHFVNLRIHYVDLPNLGDDSSFVSIKADGALDPFILMGVIPPRNVTIPAQRVWVEYYGPKDTDDKRAGFYLSYSARPAVDCPLPAAGVVEHRMIHVHEEKEGENDVATVSCAPGFAAEIAETVICGANSTWDKPFPDCVHEDGTDVDGENGGVWNGTSTFELDEDLVSLLANLDDPAANSSSPSTPTSSSNSSLVRVLDVVIVREDPDSTSSSPSFSVGDLDLEKTRVFGLRLWIFLAILGAGLVLVILLSCCVCFVVFAAKRRRFPGGIESGRKFDTFENPIYSRINLRPPATTLSSFGGGLSPDVSRGASRLSHVLDDADGVGEKLTVASEEEEEEGEEDEEEETKEEISEKKDLKGKKVEDKEEKAGKNR